MLDFSFLITQIGLWAWIAWICANLTEKIPSSGESKRLWNCILMTLERMTASLSQLLIGPLYRRSVNNNNNINNNINNNQNHILHFQDEEEIAEANEKRGIVTRGEYFSSSRYSSRRSSAVTTPGEPEEGFCRWGRVVGLGWGSGCGMGVSLIWGVKQGRFGQWKLSILSRS